MAAKKIYHSKLVFNLVIICLIISLTALGYKFISRKDSYVIVEMIGSGGEWWWQTPAPPYWISESFHSGDVEYGMDGKINAQVLSINTYEQNSYGQNVSNKQYIARVKLRAEINPKNKSIIYKGLEIHISDPISIKPVGRNMSGNITWIEGLTDNRKPVHLEVVAKAYDRYPWFADSIKKGLIMTDGSGRAIAEVKDVSVNLTEITVTTATGNVFARLNPLKRDITVTLDLSAVKSEDRLLFAPDQVIKVGLPVWIYTPKINLDDFKIVSFKEIP